MGSVWAAVEVGGWVWGLDAGLGDQVGWMVRY